MAEKTNIKIETLAVDKKKGRLCMICTTQGGGKEWQFKDIRRELASVPPETREALKRWVASSKGNEAIQQGGAIMKYINEGLNIPDAEREELRTSVLVLLDEVGMTIAGTRDTVDTVVLEDKTPMNGSKKPASKKGEEPESAGAPRSRVNKKHGGAPRGRRREEAEMPGMRRRKPNPKFLPLGPDGKPRKPSEDWGYEPDKETMPDVIVAKFLELQSQDDFYGAIKYITNYMSSSRGQKEEVRLKLLKELERMKLADRIDIKSELKENGIDLDQSFLSPKASAKPEAPKGPKYGEIFEHKVKIKGKEAVIKVAIGPSSSNENNITFYLFSVTGEEPLRKKTGAVYAPTLESPQTWGIVIEEKEGKRRIVKKGKNIPDIPYELQGVANRLAKEYLDKKYGKPAEDAGESEKKTDTIEAPEQKPDAKGLTEFKKITTETPQDHIIKGMVYQVKITVNTAARGRIASVEFVSARRESGDATVKVEEAKKEGIEFGKVYTLSELPGVFKHYFKKNAGEIYASLTDEKGEEKPSPEPAGEKEESAELKTEKPKPAHKPDKKQEERAIKSVNIDYAGAKFKAVADSSKKGVLTVGLESPDTFEGMEQGRLYEISELPDDLKGLFRSKIAPTYDSVMKGENGEVIPAESSLPLDAGDWRVYLQDMGTEEELAQFKERMIVSKHWQENEGTLKAEDKKYAKLMSLWREKMCAIDPVFKATTEIQRAHNIFKAIIAADNSTEGKRTSNRKRVEDAMTRLTKMGYVTEVNIDDRKMKIYNPEGGADKAAVEAMIEDFKLAKNATSKTGIRKRKSEVGTADVTGAEGKAVSAESAAESITLEKAIEFFEAVKTKSDFIKTAKMCAKAGLLQITVEEGRLKGMKVTVSDEDQAKKLVKAIVGAQRRYKQSGNGDKEPKAEAESSAGEEAPAKDKHEGTTPDAGQKGEDAADESVYKIMTPAEIIDMLFKYMERKSDASDEEHTSDLLLGAGWAVLQGERGEFLEVIKEPKLGHAPQVRKVYYKPKEGVNEQEVMDVLEALEIVVGSIPQKVWEAKNVGYKLVVAKKGEKSQPENPKKPEPKKARESQAVAPFNGTVTVEGKEVTVEECKNDKGVRAWEVTASNHPDIMVGAKGTLARDDEGLSEELKAEIRHGKNRQEDKAKKEAAKAAKGAGKKPDDDGSGDNGSSSGGGEKPSPANGGRPPKKLSKAERQAAMERRAQQDVSAAAKKTQGANDGATA